MAVYTFVNGRRKTEFTYNPRVMVNGTMKKIVGGYTFINGERHKIFGKWSFDNTVLYTDDVMDTLTLGHYQIVLRAGGGASGKNGQNGTGWGGAVLDGGLGGAGAAGEIKTAEFDIYNDTKIHLHIGKGGLSSNGNGGVSANSPYGDGGDGGTASYVIIYDEVFFANGGAGGGGGGSAGNAGRNAGSRPAGAGGGYYKFKLEYYTKSPITLYYYAGLDVLSTEDNLGGQTPSETYLLNVFNIDQPPYTETFNITESENKGIQIEYIATGATLTIENELEPHFDIVSIAGKNSYVQTAGQTGNIEDFPEVYSGAGKGGQATSGYAGANGGGASGGGAGRGSNDGGSYSGGAGGGAGGSPEAGGGTGGAAVVASKTGNSAYNAYNIPIDTLEENSAYGVNVNYGMGGGDGNGGSNGFILIRRLEGVPVPRPVEIKDLGIISTIIPTETDDAGYIASVVEESDDAGSITGTVESSDDAGTIYTETESTPWVLGLITETVSETTNCGNIM